MNENGLFVQYYEGNTLITVPEKLDKVAEDKNAWHFCVTPNGEFYETYSKYIPIMDASEYEFYRKDTGERVGSVTYGGLHYMFSPSAWELRDLLEVYGHRTVLPFIAVFGTNGDFQVLMPESGEEVFRMAESHLCRKLFFVAGYQTFIPCDWNVIKNEEGKFEFSIRADDKTVYRLVVEWETQEPFSDYQNQIWQPWEIDQIRDPEKDFTDLPFD